MYRRTIRCIPMLVLLGSTVVPALAQNYPTKTIRLIVPFTPGGGNDISARFIAQRLTKSFKQSVIVENRPGAGSNVGTDMVAKATADGGAGSARFARGCDPVAGCTRRM